MSGFISLHRKIKDHWIWQDERKLKWWLDILFSVNHSGNKVNIGYELFECKRGQSVKSLKNWADGWNVSKDTARNFFKLLVKDKMITLENLTKTTRLTVCNYDSYQLNIHDKQTQSKRKPNAKQTQSDPNNNDNKENNDNKLKERSKLFGKTLDAYKNKYPKKMLIEFYYYWTEPNKSNSKLRYEMEKTWDLERRLSRWANNNYNK